MMAPARIHSFDGGGPARTAANLASPRLDWGSRAGARDRPTRAQA